MTESFVVGEGHVDVTCARHGAVISPELGVEMDAPTLDDLAEFVRLCREQGARGDEIPSLTGPSLRIPRNVEPR